MYSGRSDSFFVLSLSKKITIQDTPQTIQIIKGKFRHVQHLFQKRILNLTEESTTTLLKFGIGKNIGKSSMQQERGRMT